jgi:phosphodiesterase/alkaline phosphatase D-like protein
VSGGQAISGTVQQFTTSASPPQTPIAQTGDATEVGSTDAILNGTVNPGGPATVSYQFAYGTSATDLSQSTTATDQPGGTTAAPVQAAVSGLSASTTYFYRLDITFNGTTYSGSVQSFTTSAVPPPQTPIAQTQDATQVGSTDAILNGTVNPGGPATVSYHFAYGTSAASLNQSTTATDQPGGTTAAPVQAAVSGLSASTTYFYRLDITLNGTTYSGSVQSFTTSAAPPPPQTPIAGTGGATQVRDSSAVLNGTVNPGGPAGVTYQFSYGTSAASLNQSTTATDQAGATIATPVQAFVGGLSAGTTYFYRLDITFNGTTYSGSVQSFTTVVPAPSVETGSANVHGVSATISGTVDPNGFDTSYNFEFGTKEGRYTESSASASAGSGRSAENVSATLAGLRPHTTYHYRLVATSVGGTAAGADRTFRTGAKRPHAPRFSFKLKQSALGAAVTHGLRVTFSCSSACQASVTAFRVLPGFARAASLPVTLARGAGRLQRAGTAALTLHFTRAARRHLPSAKKLMLIVTGAAGNGGSETTANVQTVMLRRR